MLTSGALPVPDACKETGGVWLHTYCSLRASRTFSLNTHLDVKVESILPAPFSERHRLQFSEGVRA